MLVTRQKTLRKFWYPVMPVAMLREGPKPFTLLGERIVLWLDAAGRPAALRDRCCHRTAELSKGFCEGDHLVCGYHGWTYDRSGRCVRIPQSLETAIPANSRVDAYRTEARYGYVWVALEEPLAGIPDLPEAEDPAMRHIDQFYEVWRCCAFRLMENSFDMSHIAFTHRTSFGIVEQPKPELMRIEPSEWGMETYVETPVRNFGGVSESVTGSSGERTVRTMRGKWFLPFVRRLGISYPSGLRHSIITCATPIDDRSMLCIQWCYRSDREEDVPARDIIAFDRKVTEEDREILESTDFDVCIDTTRRVEFHMETDKPGLIMRQKLLALFRAHGEDEAFEAAAAPARAPGERALV
jgi:phenylpropionate dioxygenase-like ring-hydroxylating dioxygenase large terminal subunit